MTKNEERCIRLYWHPMPLRFRANGTVEGKKNGSWRILYTSFQLATHVGWLRLKKDFRGGAK